MGNAKQQILDEIHKLTERLETLKSALLIINEFESAEEKSSNKTVIKPFISKSTKKDESSFNYSTFSKRVHSNNSQFIIDILRAARKPIPTSEVRKLYALKVGRPEFEIQQFVDSTLYKSAKFDRGIIKVNDGSSKHTLYTLKNIK
jgi:hypothetical protein